MHHHGEHGDSFIGHIDDPHHTITRIINRLGAERPDYGDTLCDIRKARKTDRSCLAAGVLLPLMYREAAGAASRGEFVLQLIKRSRHVPQGGDLSGPGGMLNPRIDTIIMTCLRAGIPPVINRSMRARLKEMDGYTQRAVSLLLATALRESWEEVGLNPFRVRLLGPLPCYRLSLFPRTIFPLVVLVKRPWTFKPNWEVEKVVEIPLTSFFAPERYANFIIETARNDLDTARHPMTFPCFIHLEEDGTEEILWGATLYIVLTFLRTVFDFTLPDLYAARTITRAITVDYMTGDRHQFSLNDRQRKT